MAQKTKESWYQSKTNLTVTIFAKGLNNQNVDSNIQEKSLSIRLNFSDGSVFNREWNLYSSVIKSESKIQITPFKIEVILKKVKVEDWEALEAKDTSVPVHKRENQTDSRVDPKAYPSSKGSKDWEGLEQNVKKDEENEKPDGEQALHKLFQQIYSKATEETRRAMVKSYQTSGGTVLSTNWKEVGDKDYTKDRTAPKGQEFQDWSKFQ